MLEDATDSKISYEISLAQGMIEGAKATIESEEDNTNGILKLTTKVEKRQSVLIDNYLKKKV